MGQHQPQVSIGMPVYNGERYLGEALDALLGQTFSDFELIISDNGSQDRTEDICSAYAAKDGRIRYYRNPINFGAGWNFNHVFELAQGKYFRWACHDDLCGPELLEKCLEVLERNPSVILCYPQTVIINEYGHPVSKYHDGFHLRSTKPHERFQQYQHLVRHGHGCHPLFGLMRTDVLQQTLPMGSYPSSDLVLLGKLVLQGEFYEVPEPLFLKRDHPQRSLRAHRAFRERIAWYDPGKTGKLHLTRWTWFFAYLNGIRQAPISAFEHFYCYLLMVRWLVWNWIWLTKDLLKAMAWPLLKPLLSGSAERQIERELQT